MIKKCILLSFAIALLFLPCCFLIESEDWPEGDILMVTPFVDPADISSINEAYSAHSNCPWGFEHRGIDFMISQDHIPFRAVCDGKIQKMEKFFNSGNGFWQVNAEIKYNRTFTVDYAFEPFSGSESDGNLQMNSMLVSEGDHVMRGDIIGYLKYRNPGAHVDFSLKQNDESICPEDYFTFDAVQKIITILHRTFTNASMCYE